MDHLKFAQYCNIANMHKMDGKKLELSKKIDVNYSIPYIPPQMRHWAYFPGYTMLHVAVAKSDSNLANELINRGADVLKQGTENGISAIHYIVVETLKTNRSIVQKLNEFEDHQLIRVLLSAHVSTKNTSNPKCLDGLSHFHIACIVNHSDAIDFFLKAGELVDQIVASTKHSLSGYTPLHCSIKFSSIKAIELLLAHGADVQLKDATGRSPLHLLIERLINVTDVITMGKRTPRAQYESELEEIEIMIDWMLKTKTISDVNFIDDIGFTTFHMACMSKDKSIVKDFLEKGADIDKAVNNKSKLWPGWAPLHFAACTNIQTFKFLMKNGANINAENAKGETPLDFCTMRFAPTILHSILSTKEEFNHIMLSDGSTKLLDLLVAMDDEDSFAKFLQNLSDVSIKVALDSPVWPGYSVLHLSVAMNEKTKLWGIFQNIRIIEINEGPPELYNCTKSEEAIYLKRIEMCLTQGCSVSVKNAEGLSPIHLAFKLRKESALELLLNKCEENAIDPNDVSHLHIACLMSKIELVELLLNKGSSVNSSTSGCMEWCKRSANVWSNSPSVEISIRAHSTPLHIAVILEDVAMIEYLLHTGANVYTKDELGQTPIHLSMEASIYGLRVAQLLIQGTPNLANSSSKDGLSHLHVAAFANADGAINQLLQGGARVDQMIEGGGRFAGESPLHVAVRVGSARSVASLLQNGADVHVAHLTKKFASPLQYAMDYYNHMTIFYIIGKLVAEGHVGVGALDESRVTLLHLVCALGEYSLAKQLLDKGADPNAQIRDDEEYEGKWKGKRPLHVLVCETATSGFPVNIVHLANLLMMYGADATMTDRDSTPLHIIIDIICENYYSFNLANDDENPINILLAVGDVLLKNHKSYDLNPVGCQGISHFHYACSRNDLEVMKKFVDSGVDVNEMISPFARLNAGQTPLHFALQYHQKEAALFLIENGADVKAEDAQGNTPVHVVLGNSVVDLELVDALLNRGANINAKNLSFKTPLNCTIGMGRTFTLDLLTFLLNRGCKIDLLETGVYNYGIIGEIMDSVNPNEFESIFQTLIEACNLKNAIKEGFSPICSLVSIHNSDQVTLENYLETIEQLMEMGCDIDWQHSEGKTALHDAMHFSNVTAMKALLLLGADINVTDTRGKLVISIDELERFRGQDHLDIEVVKMLADHIWKAKLINLHVCEHVCKHTDNSDRSFEKLFPLDNNTKQCFHDELVKMENTDISDSLTVKDFMSDLGAVAAYPRMLAAQRQAVDEFFKCRADLREKFPEYCGLLLIQLKKLRARLALLEPARDALATLFPIELPHLCIEAILRYLKNNELKVLTHV